MYFNLDYFFFFGCFDLMILTYQDLKRGTVDSRFNWYMGGIVGSLIALVKPGLGYVTFLLVVAIVFLSFSKKYFGKGDITALTWMIMGLGILGIHLLIIWFFYFFIYALVHVATKMVLRIHEKTPFYPVLLGSFVTVTFINFVILLNWLC